MDPVRLFAALVLFACGLAASAAAQAAESYDNCTNFVESVPATIATQGVWCLRKDLSTSIVSGRAITIAANNVTLDCNDFKLGGLAAGPSSQAYGIYTNAYLNVAVRNCSVRGFHYGIYMNGGVGHLIEDNRLDNNLNSAILLVQASNSTIRGNRVYDTGGYPDNSNRYGIYAYGGDAIEIIDNVVAGVVGTGGYYNNVVGIYRGNYIPNGDLSSAHITGNRISGLVPNGAGMVGNGFQNGNFGGTDSTVLFANNDVVMTIPVAGSYGIRCIYNGISLRNNTIRGFPTAFDAVCMNDGGNVSH